MFKKNKNNKKNKKNNKKLDNSQKTCYIYDQKNIMNITYLVTGLAGIGLIQVIPEVLPTDPRMIQTIIQTIVQLLIGIVTLWGLFKKRK